LQPLTEPLDHGGVSTRLADRRQVGEQRVAPRQAGIVEAAAGAAQQVALRLELELERTTGLVGAGQLKRQREWIRSPHSTAAEDITQRLRARRPEPAHPPVAVLPPNAPRAPGGGGCDNAIPTGAENLVSELYRSARRLSGERRG
jgi:hypothetical protein